MKRGAYVLLSPDRKLRAADLFALRKNSICIVTYRPQRCRGLGQLDSKLAKARTQTVYNSRFTTWRRHEILRQFECFRRSPSVPIASRTTRPRFLRFEPSVESG